MSELLYKLLGKNTANVARNEPSFEIVEKGSPKYADAIIPLVDASYEIGLEVEVEKVSGQDGVCEYPVWYTHTDGSLRGGVEFVTHPIKGSRIYYALNWLFAKLLAFHFSPRTSIHVHLNMLDVTTDQMKAFLCAYLPFERLFFRFVGGNREKSNFCVPLLDTGVRVFKYFDEDAVHLSTGMQEHRYMAVNLAAISKFGTLEFRHLGGTNDKVKIMRWINLIFCLKRYCKNNSFESIKYQIERLNTNSNYLQFFNSVFNECGQWLDSSNLQRDMEQAVSIIKTYAINNSFKQKIVNAFAKTDWWYAVLKKEEKIEKKKEFTWPAPEPRVRRAGVRITRDPVEPRYITAEELNNDYNDFDEPAQEPETPPRPHTEPINGETYHDYMVRVRRAMQIRDPWAAALGAGLNIRERR